MARKTEKGMATAKRAERRSRSVLLHGTGGAMLRIFGTYQISSSGKPEKIVVRAYHKKDKAQPWEPSDPSVLSTVAELEDEIRDWELRGTAIGYRRLVKRGMPGAFTKDSIPAPGLKAGFPRPPRKR